MTQDIKGDLIKMRRELHRIPEPGFSEEKTAAYVARYLEKCGLKVETGIAKTEVAGLLEMGERGKTFMIRADIDAVQVPEKTGLPFASVHEGMMHASAMMPTWPWPRGPHPFSNGSGIH